MKRVLGKADWSTYQPRPKEARNGFETVRMYFNGIVLIVVSTFVLASILGFTFWRDLQPLFNRVW
jgi:hypothetical protein